jgi:nicotinamidase-related amidase
MKPALLVIDIQKEFFKDDEGTIQSLKSALAYINAAIALFRQKNLPVISIQHIDEAEGLAPGNAGFDLPDDLNVLSSDLHIHKRYGNAFVKTGLAENLRNLGADPIILSGYCAEYCVLSTYRGAMDLDLNPILLRDALASGSEANIRFVERISDVISLGALKSFIELG